MSTPGHTLLRGWILAVSVFAVAFARPADAQFQDAWACNEVRPGQEANLFLRWNGQTRAAGFLVDLPAGWTLRGGTALRHGYVRIPLKGRKAGGAANRFDIPSALRGKHDIVLHVQAGDLPGEATWSVVPYARGSDRRRVTLEGQRVSRTVRHVEPTIDRTNRVLERTAKDTPVVLRADRLPQLTVAAAHTLELWLRTVALGTVVVSTWDGDDASPYALELTVDASGRLRYYRSQGERHVSMVSRAPVADGQWHHAAVTHDPAAKWSYLLMDGHVVDSLYGPAPTPEVEPRNLAIGHRLESTAGDGRFVGAIDELRIWPEARSADRIRDLMRQPGGADRSDVAVLGFEEAPQAGLLARGSGRATAAVSDLAFYRALKSFAGAPGEDGIRLSWEASDPLTEGFLVERSLDGVEFVQIGEVRKAEDGGNRYGFTDGDAWADVVFYRLRQLFRSGPERMSGTVKLGLGEEEADDIVLVGNFPNPFNPNTTVTYEVREPQRVSVSVWDLSGQLVADLVDADHRAGTFNVEFQAVDLPTGTYFVRMQGTGGSLQTRKIVLMK